MRVLVTGCAGFLGQAIARQLVVRGDHVVGLVRRPAPTLAALGVELKFGDLRERATIDEACRDCDAVIHTAAIAGVWGPWKTYYDTNTLASRWILQACQSQAIPTLVYCSSPSVTFHGTDQSGVDESEPYPRHYLCHYPHTKALAEQEILAAHQPGRLHTAALRPHLIWGPGDPHLLPRLVDRAQRGRLRIVGPGNNRIDTVHVENAALAHVLALDALRHGPTAGGRAYFVSQDEPIGCWDWINQLLDIAGAPRPTRRITLTAAYNLGAAMELLYRLLRRTQEPPMTRFVALQLAKEHWFNLSAAKDLLGYRPQITTAEGLAQLRQASPSS